MGEEMVSTHDGERDAQGGKKSMKKKETIDIGADETQIRGAPWELLVDKIVITPEAVADALRDAGFWTAEDIGAKPHKAQAVLRGLMGYSAVSLARAARQMKGVKDGE